MASSELLFSLLRLVALVAPAMAILMQVIEQKGGSSNASFRFLEIGLFLMIVGGSIIMWQLITTIKNDVTHSATFLIFGSLLFVALAIAWNAVPATRNLEVSISSTSGLIRVMKLAVGKLIAFSIPPLITYGIYHLSHEYAAAVLEVGLPKDVLSANLFYAVLLSLIVTRVFLYLSEVGFVSEFSSKDTFAESLGFTVVLYIVLPIMILPVAVVAYLLINLETIGVPLSIDSGFFIITHVWIILIFLVLFAVDLGAENEDESRIME